MAVSSLPQCWQWSDYWARPRFPLKIASSSGSLAASMRFLLYFGVPPQGVRAWRRLNGAGGTSQRSPRSRRAPPSWSTSLAQSSADMWWTGYGNGPDSSRYFASRQIDKSNVTRLQVAWTYPYGDTGSMPDRRPRRRLRARAERIARRRRRDDRQGAVGPREHERHDEPRPQLLGKRGRARPAAHLLDEQPAAGGGREDGQVDHVVRHQRRRRPARRDRWPRSGDASATSSRTRPAGSSRT